MQPLIWERRPDGLRAPALVCAFKGWNDAGDAASAALQFVGASLGATRFARIDPEEFFDFQATRPKVTLVEGRTREIEWPEVEIYEARVPRAPRDLVLLQGAEPSLRWRTFCQLIVDLAEALGAQLVVTLGALLADVPHTRPVPITGLSSDDALVDRLGAAAVRLRGPDRDRRRAAQRLPGGRHAVGVACGRASRTTSRPRRTRRRRSRSCASSRALVGVSVDAEELERAAADYERQVSLAVQSDPDVQAFVERLERAAEEEEQEMGPQRPALRRRHRARVPALPAPARAGPDGLSPAPRARSPC